jgi:hypothetical protein
MFNREFVTMNEAYWQVYCGITNGGQRFTHRGTECLELRPFHMTISCPQLGLFTGVARRMNYRFWAAETLGYIAGWGLYDGRRYAELLVKLNSNYANFRDAYTGLLNPMVRYGDGFYEGLPRAYDTLLENYDRRQAYISIWQHNTKHSYEESPCMTGCQFFTEQLDPDTLSRSLSMLVHMRSNDLNWGVPYDVASMCTILCTMAGALGLPVGRYYHTATSMHYYLNGKMGEAPPRVHPPTEGGFLVEPPSIPQFTGGMMQDAQAIARELLSCMHDHFVVAGGKGKDFDMGSDERFSWAHDWCEVVRWSWPKEHVKNV